MASASSLRYFRDSEFPRGVLQYMDPAFLQELDKWRHSLGHAVRLSPVFAGWVRSNGSTGSRHYTGDGRLSDAGDVFPSCHHQIAWMAAMNHAAFGGIGIYYDTQLNGKPRVMFHLDTRPGPRAVWARHKGEYIYPARSMRERVLFFKLLGEDEPWKI